MQNWSSNRDTLLNKIPSEGYVPNVLITSASGSVVVTHSRFDAFEGKGDELPYTVLAMCTGGGGRTRRESDNGVFDDYWQPGRIGLALPSSSAQGFTPTLEMLLIAFDLNDVPACHGQKLSKNDLQLAASRLFKDELVSVVLTAMLRDAEAHGAASAFFDHGLSLVLHRLAVLTKTISRQPIPIKSSKNSFSEVLDLMESRLNEDLRVKELAVSQGLSDRTFTRMFKRETGLTPYRYLTIRRMERAKMLLSRDDSVTDTALSVGYENPAKFAAAFRRWIGLTPSEWKKKH